MKQGQSSSSGIIKILFVRSQMMSSVIESLQQNVSAKSLADDVPKESNGISAEDVWLKALSIATNEIDFVQKFKRKHSQFLSI
jgi:hypothetical protein